MHGDGDDDVYQCVTSLSQFLRVAVSLNIFTLELLLLRACLMASAVVNVGDPLGWARAKHATNPIEPSHRAVFFASCSALQVFFVVISTQASVSRFSRHAVQLQHS
jgi:hypothetical protein